MIVVEIPRLALGLVRGVKVTYADTGDVVEHVVDLKEHEEVVGGKTLRSLRLLILCDPRFAPRKNLLRGGSVVGAEISEGLVACWFSFPEYEVRGGDLRPDRNTREEWP